MMHVQLPCGREHAPGGVGGGGGMRGVNRTAQNTTHSTSPHTPSIPHMCMGSSSSSFILATPNSLRLSSTIAGSDSRGVRTDTSIPMHPPGLFSNTTSAVSNCDMSREERSCHAAAEVTGEKAPSRRGAAFARKSWF